MVILIGSQAPIESCATYFTILSRKSVFWYVGPFYGVFLGPNISLFAETMVLAPTVILKCVRTTERTAFSIRPAPSGKDYFPYIFCSHCFVA